MHFFYHPAKNRLVEVIPSDTSSPETIARVEQYCKMLGKVVIVCKDRPGFVVNRFFVPWLNEACLLLEEGVATTAQIDAVACAAFDIGMGPFALMNLTGPPIALHSTNYLAEQLQTPRYTGAQNLCELVEKSEMWEIGEDTDCSEEVRPSSLSDCWVRCLQSPVRLLQKKSARWKMSTVERRLDCVG
ncbi:MAG: hypothetical protein Ct9H90mP16_05980 [Candidatus Poseidoniales archaeon]|nr:MAG: hypothetical protein Ct9H90mP16_05980 [Candidatus Poseidoniales archaeon]